MAFRIRESSHTQAEASESVSIFGPFNFSISDIGSGNTVELQRSFDAGSTWRTIGSYTSAGEFIGSEPEENVLYRFEVTDYSADTVTARISQ